ncbi:hypothetical protein FRC05_006993 [Tulasnella sp. 425]|nr:hypothetical protein FRC05_006993 [Tulasnella sp. 425]
MAEPSPPSEQTSILDLSHIAAAISPDLASDFARLADFPVPVPELAPVVEPLKRIEAWSREQTSHRDSCRNLLHNALKLVVLISERSQGRPTDSSELSPAIEQTVASILDINDHIDIWVHIPHRMSSRWQPTIEATITENELHLKSFLDHLSGAVALPEDDSTATSERRVEEGPVDHWVPWEDMEEPAHGISQPGLSGIAENNLTSEVPETTDKKDGQPPVLDHRTSHGHEDVIPSFDALQLDHPVNQGSGGVADLEKWAKFVTAVPGQHGRFKMKTGSSPIHGGFSDVWECDAKFSDATTIAVAVKQFRAVRIDRDADENTVHGKLLKRLTKELEIWMGLKHPNITPLLGFVLLGDLCTISPWYSNGNVASYINQHPDADRIKLVSDVACGLAYLHNLALPVIHGDMKPVGRVPCAKIMHELTRYMVTLSQQDNVLIDETGGAVIIDFGLSSIMEDEPTLATSFTSVSLQDAGNARWMAPELIMEATCTRSLSTDIYSFGCVALFIYTGEIPFKGIPYIQIFYALIKGRKPIANRDDYPAISSTNAEWFYGLLVSCWDAEPSSRPSMWIVEERMRSGDTTEGLDVITARHRSSRALPKATLTAISVRATPSLSHPSDSILIPAVALHSHTSAFAPVEGLDGGIVQFITTVPGQHGHFKVKTGSTPIYGGFSDVWECVAKFSDGTTIPVGATSKQSSLAHFLHLSKRFNLFIGQVAVKKLRAICLARDEDENAVTSKFAKDNVLIDETGGAVIIDFGLSSSMETEPASTTSFISASFRDAGNVRWMAPELLIEEGCARSLSTDIYSFGSVALFIYAGEIPFKGIPSIRIIYALIQGQKPVANRDDYPAVSSADAEWFYEVLVSCWDDNPSSRPSIGIVEERMRLGDTIEGSDVITAQPRRQTSLVQRSDIPVVVSAETCFDFYRLAARCTPVPGLAPVVETLRMIDASVERVTWNKSRCRKLRAKAMRVTFIICDHYDNERADTPKLQTAIEKTVQAMHDIGVDVRVWAALSVWKSWNMRHEVDLRITQHEENLKSLAEYLSLAATLQIHDKVAALQESLKNNPRSSADRKEAEEQLYRLRNALAGELADLTPPELAGECVWLGSQPEYSGTRNDIWKGRWLDKQDVALIFYKEYKMGAKDENGIRRFEGQIKFEGETYLVSPWLQNRDVLKYLEGDAGRHRKCLSSVTEIALGLRYIHSQDIIHGSLKPSNVLVQDDGHAVLSDFSLAEPATPDAKNTQTSLQVNVSRYHAPEVILDKPISKAADVYSWAMTALEVITGAKSPPPASQTHPTLICTFANNVYHSGGLSKGAPVAAGLIPLIVFAALGVYVKIPRGRKLKKRQRWSQAVDKRAVIISRDRKAITPAGASAAIGQSMAFFGGDRGTKASSFFADYGTSPVRRPSTTFNHDEPNQAGVGARHGGVDLGGAMATADGAEASTTYHASDPSARVYRLSFAFNTLPPRLSKDDSSRTSSSAPRKVLMKWSCPRSSAPVVTYAAAPTPAPVPAPAPVQSEFWHGDPPAGAMSSSDEMLKAYATFKKESLSATSKRENTIETTTSAHGGMRTFPGHTDSYAGTISEEAIVAIASGTRRVPPGEDDNPFRKDMASYWQPKIEETITEHEEHLKRFFDHLSEGVALPEDDGTTTREWSAEGGPVGHWVPEDMEEPVHGDSQSELSGIVQNTLNSGVPETTDKTDDRPPVPGHSRDPTSRSQGAGGAADLEKWINFITVVPGQDGRFKIKIGSNPIYGGFSDVWECDAKFSDGTTISAAVKKFRAVRILPDADENAVTSKLFKRLNKELRIWMSLKHRNIAPLLGFVLSGDLCIISPWYPNGNVESYIILHPEADRIKLVSDVACGLSYLHNRAHPVIHGDMKPDNVLIDETGGAVIIDFGLSSVIETEPTLATSFTSASLQDAGNPSFGCVALFIYTGELPFKDIIYIQIIHALIQGQKPVANRDDYPALSAAEAEWFYRLLVSCWNAEPSSRPSIGTVEERMRSGDTTSGIDVITAQDRSSLALPKTTTTTIPTQANPSPPSPPSQTPRTTTTTTTMDSTSSSVSTLPVHPDILLPSSRFHWSQWGVSTPLKGIPKASSDLKLNSADNYDSFFFPEELGVLERIRARGSSGISLDTIASLKSLDTAIASLKKKQESGEFNSSWDDGADLD